MLPINNSDIAWLIVSDYNQDNDIGFPDSLREDIVDPDINHWYWEWNKTIPIPGLNAVDGVGMFGAVGGGGSSYASLISGPVGSVYSVIGGERSSGDHNLVGGNAPNK
jgi:hypothetical protein